VSPDTSYLEIEYRPSYWVHQLRTEIARTPALAAADAQWATSSLLDLAFSLETRIGNLIEIQRQTDENLRVVGEELQRAAELDSLVAGGYAYRVENQVALRRIVIGLNSLVIESRSCFETLARFYREFLRAYFGETISDVASYKRVAAAVPVAGWAEDLRLTRHDIVHDRSPWIRYKVQQTPPRFQAVLLLEYRPSSLPCPGDEITLEALRSAQHNLTAALATIRSELIDRVRSLQ
jgi:hypothetical protein